MGRSPRVDAAGYGYHVLNRGNGRMTVFEDDGDYEAFERILEQAAHRWPRVGIAAYCLMPNHWHLVLHPTAAGELSRFVGWVTLTHTQRWHAHRKTAGGGHVYQGRFRSFMIQTDGHFAAVCRYVERNPLRANLVRQAERWRWSSLWRWTAGDAESKALLCPWPTPGGRRPGHWLERVNRPQSQAELAALRRCTQRGAPYGDDRWQRRILTQFGLESSLRPRGRPKKKPTRRTTKGAEIHEKGT